jgi:hypothetical protein
MSEFSRFMKQNQIKKENTTYPATESLVDEDGKALLWEIRPITTSMNDAIVDECSYEVQVTGKLGLYRTKVNQSKLKAKVICASVVYPNLHDKKLQDSYGVSSDIELIKEMIPTSGEYNRFVEFINDFNGFTSMQEDVDEAKN